MILSLRYGERRSWSDVQENMKRRGKLMVRFVYIVVFHLLRGYSNIIHTYDLCGRKYIDMNTHALELSNEFENIPFPTLRFSRSGPNEIEYRI